MDDDIKPGIKDLKQGTERERPMRILYAEDTDSLREIYTEFLAERGHTVDAVADGEDAINRLKAGNKYDLVLLDSTMKRINGTEVLQFIRNDERLRKLSVIFLSNDRAIKSLVEELGGVFIPKMRPTAPPRDWHNLIRADLVAELAKIAPPSTELSS